MSAFHDIILAGAAGQQGYKISRSVRLRSSASAYFNRTPASAGNQQKWTWSGWAKRGSFGQQQLFGAGAGTGGSPECYIDFEDNLNFQIFDGTSNLAIVRSTAVYRDPSAWYHVVVAVDTTQATAANRVLLYINGQQITSFAFSTYPTQNLNTQVNATTAHRISSSTRISAYYFDGYLTEVNFIDGQALIPSSFGETDSITGVWKPKKYGGTYGTNGFYLNFSDNSAATAAAIGKDYSGNGNNWTPNNISVTAGVTYDSMLDVPTPYADGGNGRGNYCVLNPLDKGGGALASNGNIQLTTSAAGSIRSTIGMTSGKWYFESTFVATTGTAGLSIGGTALSAYTGSLANEWGYGQNGQKITGGTGVAYGATFTSGDVIGVAFDADAGTLTFYKNNVSQGAAFTGLTSGPYFFTVGDNQATSGQSVNFGQRPFTYTPPTGFKALNTQNLPDSTIKNGAGYMAATTYTGNGSTLTVTNAGGFAPDLVWIKNRASVTNHILSDSVRDASGWRLLFSNSTAAELYSNLYITSLNSNGFSLSSTSDVNQNAVGHVGWQWKKGATQGFDIVTYTGNGATQNINHSLGVSPKMMIVKQRSSTSNWSVYHQSLGAGNVIWMNLTNAFNNTLTYWNNTAPTSSQFSVGNAADTNTNAATYVAYLFAEVAGFSKFGSYTGNGSTDGPFVYLGFRPRYVMVKRTDLTNDWFVVDTSRDIYNIASALLRPNTSAAEQSAGVIDILSNGIKPRTSDSAYNASGGTYIYAAFAENPFKNSLAR